MAVTKQQKAEILAELTSRFKEAGSIGFATTNTLSVAEFSDLRNGLREVGASYMVAKKTLIVKAMKDALDIEMDPSTLPGQIGVVCSNEDAMAGLGKVNDLVKESKWEKAEWAACVFEGELKNLEETKQLAGMPSRDTLLGRLVGSMQSPVSGLARWFDAAAKELEAKGVDSVGKLEWDAPAAEATKAEEKKEEAPKEEVKSEKKAEETVEAPKEESAAPAEESKTEETTAETPVEEKAE